MSFIQDIYSSDYNSLTLQSIWDQLNESPGWTGTKPDIVSEDSSVRSSTAAIISVFIYTTVLPAFALPANLPRLLNIQPSFPAYCTSCRQWPIYQIQRIHIKGTERCPEISVYWSKRVLLEGSGYGIQQCGRVGLGSGQIYILLSSLSI